METIRYLREQPFYRPRKSKKKYLFWVLVLLIAAATAAVIFVGVKVGLSLTQPEREAMLENTGDYGLDYEEIQFASRDGEEILSGWYLPGGDSGKAVIFAHGYGKNRLQTDVPGLELARDLVNLGYNVVMFDFRNSGESTGKITSIGQFEQQDLLGAIDYTLNKEGNNQIALLGFSMGAVTAILAGGTDDRVAGIIADSPFADLTLYLEENLSIWTELPEVPFNFVIMKILPVLTGITPQAVSPASVATTLKTPLLLIHGDEDKTIPMNNSERILEAAREGAASLVIIPGAKHMGGYSQDRELFLEAVTAFLTTIFE